MAGCNFKCRGCFSNERHYCGSEVSPGHLADNIPKGKEVMLAGGEPAIDRHGLLSLLGHLDGRRVILSTNGYLLDNALLEELDGITVHIDLKALDPAIHKWYTGKDNNPVLEVVRLLYGMDFDFQVSTVYIPDVVETGEIENIARYLSGIGDISYKVIRYVPVGDFSRRPGVEEIEDAVSIAGRYLKDVTSSIDNRSHPSNREIIHLH